MTVFRVLVLYLPQKFLSKLFFWKKYGSEIPYLPTIWTHVQSFVVFVLLTDIGECDTNTERQNIKFFLSMLEVICSTVNMILWNFNDSIFRELIRFCFFLETQGMT